MTALPRALEPWRSSLEKLAPDLVGGFSPLVRRLSLAIGPYPASSRSGDGEPDGYDGLARRGLYERLLATDWLLASEMPDEFLRRASVGEHAFLQLARKVPSGGRRSVALFDGGPSQLGTPRVAHLAALIALAHRAERAGVAFAWGILQLPEAALLESVSQANVLALLAAAGGEAATAAHLQAWRDRLDDEELWVVGSAPLANIAVADVVEEGARQLEVTVRRARLRLELPSDADCTRLLRDPFRVVVAPPRERPLPARPVGNPLFTPDERRILVGLADDRVAILPIPTSARMTPGRPGLFVPRKEKLVAAGGRAGQTWVATVAGDSVAIYRLGKRGGVAVRGEYRVKPSPLPGPPFGTLVAGDGFTFTDSAGHLFHVHGAEISFGDAAALTADGTRALWIDAESPEEKRRRVYKGNQSWSWECSGPELSLTSPAEAFFAADELRSHHIAAIRQDDGWAILRLRREQPFVEAMLHPAGHAGVVGALMSPPSLVLLDEGRRSLSVVSRSLSRVLVQSSREIASAAVSPRGKYLAWLTTEGALTVMAAGSGEIVMRVEAP